jgi:hypothetical protein
LYTTPYTIDDEHGGATISLYHSSTHIIETFLLIEEGENNYGTRRVVKEKRCKPNTTKYTSVAIIIVLTSSINLYSTTVSKKKRRIYRLAVGILSPHPLLSKASPMDPIHDYHLGAHMGQE